MGDDGKIANVVSGTITCLGHAAAPHPVVVIVLEAGQVRACPACGRLFRRSVPPDLVGPAVWPREE